MASREKTKKNMQGKKIYVHFAALLKERLNPQIESRVKAFYTESKRTSCVAMGVKDA